MTAKGQKAPFDGQPITSGLAQIAPLWPSAGPFRCTPINRHFWCSSACLKGANAQSRCAPARCAGARAERPVAAERTAIAGLPRLTRVLSACNA